MVLRASTVALGISPMLPRGEVSSHKGGIVVSEKTDFENETSERRDSCRVDGHVLPRARKRHDAPLSLPFTILSRSGDLLQCHKEIGHGGYSRCYRLKATNGRHYAMKAVARTTLATQVARARFESEVNIHSQLKHPGIVRFLESHCTPTHLFLVLEYCPNGTLHDWLKKHSRMPEIITCEVMLHVFDAVNFLHEKLIFHGDLKLSNIVLDAAMRPKLCDFGFAKQLTSAHQKRHSPYGTPSYMAREIVVPPQCFGLEADVWSLGVIIYTLLHGVTPFEGKCTDEVYDRIARLDLKFPLLSPPVSASARILILRMLDAIPEQRPLVRDLRSSPWLETCASSTLLDTEGKTPKGRISNMIAKSLRIRKESLKIQALNAPR